MAGVENLQCIPGKEFLFRWRIKNISMFGIKGNQIKISSTFVVPLLGNIKWYLKMIFENPQESSIMFFLCRDEDDGPECVRAYYSILVYSSYVVELQTFAKNSSCFVPGIINQDRFNDDCGLSRDVLQVECRLWPDRIAEVPTQVSPYPVSIEVVTIVPKQIRSLFYKIPSFSNLPDGQVIEFSVGFVQIGIVKNFTCRLWIEQQTLRVLVHDFLNTAIPYVLKCNVHLLDAFGDRHLLYHGRTIMNFDEGHPSKTMNFPLGMTKKQLMEKKDLYLPGDALLLHWELAYSDNLIMPCSLDHTLYDEPLDLQVNRQLTWRLYLDRTYNEHRLLFRLLALLVVFLSVLPHVLFDSTP